MKNGDKELTGESVCKSTLTQTNPYFETSCESIGRKVEVDSGVKILYIQVNNE